MSDLIFPVLAGSTIGVEREAVEATAIQSEASGRELAIAQQSARRYRWTIGYDFLRQDSGSNEAAILEGFHAACRGQFGRFLYADPYDDAITAQEFAVGDGTTTAFRLQKAPGGVRYDALGTWPVYTASRTNLLTYSEQFDNAAWAKVNTTVTASQAIAPDGTATADKLKEDATAAVQHKLTFTPAPALATTNYTLSVYVKRSERFKVQFRFGASCSADFDLAAVTATPGTGTPTVSITALAGGWYRCTMAGIATAADPVYVLLVDASGNSAYNGTSGEGLYLWGAQLEAGSTATRYIPTTSAPVTERPAWWPSGAAGWEPVQDPIWPGVTVYKNGVVQAGGTAWTPGAGGVVTFAAAPASGDLLAWSGSFYRRCRFASDGLRLQRRVARIWRGEAELLSVI